MPSKAQLEVQPLRPATVDFANWLKDALAHGPALQAAIDRYAQVYSEMQRAPVVNTCIESRKGAMAAAIEAYAALVAAQQAKEVKASLSPATKGLLIAASYHLGMEKEFIIDAARLDLVHKTHGDEESLELSKIALSNAKSHSDSASDMARMAIGDDPVHLDDAFGEFDKTSARILRQCAAVQQNAN